MLLVDAAFAVQAPAPASRWNIPQPGVLGQVGRRSELFRVADAHPIRPDVQHLYPA